MTQNKFIFSSLTVAGSTYLLIRLLELIIFFGTHPVIALSGNFIQLPLYILSIEFLLACLIGAILGYFFSINYLNPTKINFDPNKETQSPQENKASELVNENASTQDVPESGNACPPPLTPHEAAVQNEKNEMIEKFSEKVSEGTFEEPKITVENPGEKLVENPATMFNKPPVEDIKKTDLDDESFPKKLNVKSPPTP